MFLKYPEIIIIRFLENNVLCPKYIDIYEFGGYGGMYIFHRTYFVYYSKKRKKYKNMTYIKMKFYMKQFFLGWIIKIYEREAQGGPSPISLQSEYSSSNWFHSNTLNSRHLFNTNMHLIHFHSKTHIQMRFPKSWVFKVSNVYQSLNICLRRKIKKKSYQNWIHYNVSSSDFHKKTLINNYYVYS